MTTISDAQPGDIYVDPKGVAWRVWRVTAGGMVWVEGVDAQIDRGEPIDSVFWTGWQRVFRRAA